MTLTAAQIADDEAFGARMAERDAQLDYVRSLSETDARVLMTRGCPLVQGTVYGTSGVTSGDSSGRYGG